LDRSFKRIFKPRWNPLHYFWFFFNNILGWAFILAAGPLGLIVPGPAGLPLFLIGFAMITLPGKRALTSRVLRGLPVNPRSRPYRWSLAIFAVLAPAGLIWWIGALVSKNPSHWNILNRDLWAEIIWKHAPWPVLIVIFDFSLMALIWIFGQRGVRVINLGLSIVPKIRRKARPWMRRKGMDLLPPRRRQRLINRSAPADEGILEFDDRYQRRAQRTWWRIKGWLGMGTRG